MQSVLGLPPAAFCLHLAAKSNAAIASNVLLSTPVSRRNTWPFSFLTESNLIAASLWAATNHPDLKKGLRKRSIFCLCAASRHASRVPGDCDWLLKAPYLGFMQLAITRRAAIIAKRPIV